jgi:hypothetical protein
MKSSSTTTIDPYYRFRVRPAPTIDPYYRFHVRPLGTQMSCAHHTEFVKLEKTVLTNRPKSVLKKTVLTDRGDAPTVGTNTILQEQTFGLLYSRRHSAAEARRHEDPGQRAHHQRPRSSAEQMAPLGSISEAPARLIEKADNSTITKAWHCHSCGKPPLAFRRISQPSVTSLRAARDGG